MFQFNRTTRVWLAKVALALSATLVTDLAIAAPPTLQSIAVTPAAISITVGQKQYFMAKGTFSNGSTHLLGPAFADVAPGWLGTCVLLTSGGVKCWGDNDLGQLGDGSTTDSLSPRPVKWITKATALAFRWEHGCAVLARGAVQCWGYDLWSGNYSSSLALVTGINSATAVSLGESHNCALLASGQVQCWGRNDYGQLGDGTTKAWSGVPVWVSAISTATAVVTGYRHNCALLANGQVQCWGRNEYGQLGNGTTINSRRPVTVVGIDNATAIAAGAFYNCALLTSGAVKCWGGDYHGELGRGNSVPYMDSSLPVSVTGISTAVAITAGGYHSCVVLSSGLAQCWGWNDDGQLGNGLTKASTSSTPVQVSEISAPVKLVAGYVHTCALLSDGAMRCWGRNIEGQLGNRRTTNLPTRWPVNVIGTPGVVWQSSDPLKATITDGGLATARAVGNTTITATTAGFINDNAVLTVK